MRPRGVKGESTPHVRARSSSNSIPRHFLLLFILLMRRRLCRFPRPSIKRDYVGKHFIQVLLHAHRHSNTGTTFSSRPLYPQPYINYYTLLYSTTTSKEDTFRLYYVRNDLTQHAVRLMFAPTGGRSAFKRIISTNAVMLLLHWLYTMLAMECGALGIVL